MVSRQVVQVLIEAEENVSKAAKKAEEALNKLGKTGSKAVNAISNVAGKVQNAFSNLHSFVDRAREKFTQFMNSGNKLGVIKEHISNAATSFGKLLSSSNLAARAMEKLKSVSDGIQAKFTSLGSKIKGFGSSVKSSLTSAFSLSGIKERLSQLGSSIDNLKTKLRSLASESKKTGGSGGLGFLRNAASMTVGMLGYDLVNSMMESARASLNARSGMQAFAKRLNMSGAEVSKFQSDLDSMQGTFKKIDMDVVGQQATDLAYRLGLPKESLSELTETTAIFTDAMQRNGRSAEDSMLAMSDAMDGQFQRLKEIGISQDMLMKNGWDGDIENKTGLLKAMNKSLKELHYDDLAKSVDTLDDAWKVLSVTMGNLLEAILLPLTPAIVGIVTGLTDAINGLMGFVNQLKSAFSGLPEWAQIGIAVGALALAIGILIPAFGGLGAIAAAITGPLFGVAGAIMAISWPIVAVVAAVALVVAAIYELGKAFGWWHDVGSMFEAIRNNVGRLWDAFINHPDVQAVISAISGALQWLSGAIGGAIDAVMNFFGVSTGGKWDVTRSIIDGLGFVWQILTGHIRTAISIVQAFIGALQWVYNGAVSLGSAISGILAPAFSLLGDLWNSLVEAVQPIVDVFQRFSSGQTDLLTVVTTVASTLWNIWVTLSASLGNLIVQLVSNLLTWAIQGGLNFLTGISTYLSQVAGRVGTYLAQTLARIISYGARWVSQGRAKASQFLNGVINFFKQLPGRAISALLGVVTSIVSAGSQWISHAKQKASEVVSSVVNTLTGLPGKISSALSGVVSAITGPFKQAYDTLSGIVDNIKSKASEVTGIAFGGETAWGGETAIDLGTGNSFNTNTGAYTNESSEINVNVTEKIILDLVNVPAHIDSNTLIRMLQDKEVLKSLTRNKDFQDLDNQVKQELMAKIRRSKGA